MNPSYILPSHQDTHYFYHVHLLVKIVCLLLMVVCFQVSHNACALDTLVPGTEQIMLTLAAKPIQVSTVQNTSPAFPEKLLIQSPLCIQQNKQAKKIGHHSLGFISSDLRLRKTIAGNLLKMPSLTDGNILIFGSQFTYYSSWLMVALSSKCKFLVSEKITLDNFGFRFGFTGIILGNLKKFPAYWVSGRCIQPLGLDYLTGIAPLAAYKKYFNPFADFRLCNYICVVPFQKKQHSLKLFVGTSVLTDVVSMSHTPMWNIQYGYCDSLYQVYTGLSMGSGMLKNDNTDDNTIENWSKFYFGFLRKPMGINTDYLYRINDQGHLQAIFNCETSLSFKLAHQPCAVLGSYRLNWDKDIVKYFSWSISAQTKITENTKLAIGYAQLHKHADNHILPEYKGYIELLYI